MKSLLVLNPLQLPKPFPCPKTLNPIQFPQLSIHGHGCRSRTKHRAISLRQLRIRSASSKSVAALTTGNGDAESAQLFEDAERQRINELEELEKKANIQLERQLVMASYWSRALLNMRGKLKGTEWDPENSHRIDFSDFETA